MSKNPIIDKIVKFIRRYGVTKAEWGTDFIVYDRNRRLSFSAVEAMGPDFYDMKCEMYELAILLENYYGLVDPRNPKFFYRDIPKPK